MALDQNEKDDIKKEALEDNYAQKEESHETLPETKELGLQEKNHDDIEHVLRKEIEKMDADDSLKLQAQSHATQVHLLEEKAQLDHLLMLAKQKGVVYAISVAQKMGNAYLLDRLHDVLSENGFYEHFLNK